MTTGSARSAVGATSYFPIRVFGSTGPVCDQDQISFARAVGPVPYAVRLRLAVAYVVRMLFRPHGVGYLGPLLRVPQQRLAHPVRRNPVPLRRVSARLLHDLDQHRRAVDDGTRTQVIMAEGLVFLVGPENRRLERLDEGRVLDVDVGEVDESARFDV